MATITARESLMYIRKRKKLELTVPGEAFPDIPESEDPEQEGIPPSVFNGMIARLPVGCRTILNLYVFELLRP